MDKKPINVEIGRCDLRKVEFTLSPNVAFKSYKIDVEDLVEVRNYTKASFDVFYIRKTKLNDPFYVYVEFRTFIKIIDLKQLDENKETIQEFAERKKVDIVDRLTLPSKASLLIGNITRETGNAFLTLPIHINTLEKK